jgi:hypothetical protein
MCAPASTKLGLFVPGSLHLRMLDASRGKPRGAVQDDYAAAFAGLLDALDGGALVVFAAVRGPKRRVTVRLTEGLSHRIRHVLERRNLKITDFACAAIERHHPQP